METSEREPVIDSLQKSAPSDGDTFSEERFASWMDRWADIVASMPGWRDLVLYRGVCATDAGYMPMYFRFLDLVRGVVYGELESNTAQFQDEQIETWPRRAGRIVDRLTAGDLTYSQALRMTYARLANHIQMSMPRQSLPTMRGQRRALVVRAYTNPTPFPVLKSLRDEMGWDVLFASWNQKLESPVRKLGIPYFHLERTYRRWYRDRRRQHEREVAQLLEDLDTRAPSRILSELSGLPLQHDVRNLFKQVCVQVRTLVDVYFDLLSHVLPQVVILFNEISVPDRTMALAARIAKLPSVAIQHGLFIGHVYRRMSTDKMIVWGSIPRDFWLRRGCLPQHVISVGAFGHEMWVGAEADGATNSSNRRKRVLVLGQNPAAFLNRRMHKETIDVVMRAAEELQTVDFVIKPHPGEALLPYERALEKSTTKNAKIVAHGSVEGFLRECDLVITIFSTAGLEAMLLGRPVVVVSLSPEAPLAPYVSAALLVTQRNQLVPAILRILENEEARKSLVNSGRQFALSYFGPMDGGAARRGAETVESMIT